VTYAYNNRFSGARRIGSVNLSLIKVSDKRLGATDSVKTRDGLFLVYSSRLRTLIDAVYDWSRFNGVGFLFIFCDSLWLIYGSHTDIVDQAVEEKSKSSRETLFSGGAGPS